MLRGLAASFYAAFKTLSRSLASALFISILPPLFSSLLLAGGWLLSGAVDVDKYLYQLVGSSLLVLGQIAVGETVWVVRDYVREGLYDYILASPSRILETFYGVFLAEALIFSGLSLALTAVIVGAVKGPIYGVATAVAYALAFVGILPVLGIGIILASLLPVVRDPGVLVMPVGAVLTLLGGVIYPLSILPPYLELAASALPMAALAQAVRDFALGLKLQIESLGLLGAYMLYVLVGLLVFRVMNAYARRRGIA
ncbi:MAG: ABC transporter permease [Thermoproteus sp.]|jgi:ABC-2 type transport system permease protein